MPFPSKPETDDERRTELLRLMEVGGFPGVYVLGCFARYVTVYAQQVRALNLIDALAKGGHLSRSSRVAIVGGGIAGLTAAAAAAVRGVASVSVFEKLEATMRLQRNTEKRFLHPNIYDWPADASFQNRAMLPLMDWEANTAGNVVEQLDEKWAEIRNKVGESLKAPQTGCKKIEILVDAGKPVLTSYGMEPQSYDAIILAVGFGRDAQLDANKARVTEGYWTDSSLDGLEVETDEMWFVSGAGDGALTDLMRLCIMDFKHGDVLEAVDKATREKIGQDLKNIESQRPTWEGRRLAYLNAVSKIADDLDKKLVKRNVGQVWLNCSEENFFGQGSSVLNRLIATYLYNRGRFTLHSGKIRSVEKNNNKLDISFEGDTPPMTVNNVILRHGPDKALQQGFPDIWEACVKLRRDWKDAGQYTDWTREPLYDEGDFDLEGKKCPPLRVSFGNHAGCTVIIGTKVPPGLDQKKRVEQALELFVQDLPGGHLAGRQIQITPEVISVENAFSSSAAYERAVRALCDSEMAVFDITELQSGVMLFLGIRAAVRRGVTITLTQDDLNKKPLPFNIALLNPIPFGHGDVEKIAAAFQSGFEAMGRQPEGYLDLPAFDAVRRLSEGHRPAEPKSQILLLRWFDKQYCELIDQIVKQRLLSKFGKQTKILTTLDSNSPQLVNQRLYAAIRRTELCIADWTGWRPNVFFEIGVRLAVNKEDPIMILYKNRPSHWEEKEHSVWDNGEGPNTPLLKDFFQPIQFNHQDYTSFDERIENFRENRKNRVAGAILSPGRTYRVVSQSIQRRQEPGGRLLSEFLKTEAEVIAGPSVAEEGDQIPVLFGDVLGTHFQQAAVEYLLAGWYYLIGRYKLFPPWEGECSTSMTEQLKALQDIGVELSARLRKVRGREYEEIKNEVLTILDAIDSKIGGSS